MPEIACPNCGRMNRPGARFCMSCQTPLSQSAPPPQGVTGPPCPSCRAINPSSAKFCNACGSPMSPAPASPRNATGALSLNTTLQRGRYAIEGLLGQGGMGAVYVARDTRLQKRWAVKEMSTSGLATTQELQNGKDAFRREAKMLADLSHRNLPKVIDNFEENGREYLVMELVEGQTLAKFLAKRSKPLPPEQVIAWGEQVCDVLSYLHSRRPPIIFRDLKPDNIMVDNNGVVKLIDFGIARHFTPGKKTDTAAFGTTGYAPPEQYGKGQTDARSDVYALAATLHQLLTQRDPAQDPFNFPPARQLNPAVPQGLSAALQKALSTSSADRWATAADFRLALRAPAPAKIVPFPDVSTSAAQIRPAPSVVPPARTGPSTPQPRAVQPMPVARKRAGFGAYLLIVGVLIGALAVGTLALSSLIYAAGPLGSLAYQALQSMMPILAFLLTRRPLAAFLVFSIGGVFLAAVGGYYSGSLLTMLITAASIEAVFLIRGYPVRGSRIGVVAAVVGAVVAMVTMAVMSYVASGETIVFTVIAGLLGGILAALLAKMFGRG